MVVSSLSPYIVATTHKGGQKAASLAGKLGAGTNRSQVFERTKLVGGVRGFQTTLAQLVSMCKGHCTCFPLRHLVVHFHKEGVGVVVPLYVSFDPPVLELSSGLHEVVVHGGWPQKNGLEPRQKWFNWLGGGHRLSVDFEDVRGGPWAVIVTEPGHIPLMKELDPFNGAMQPKTDVDFEPWVMGVNFVPLGALLEGLFMFLKSFFEVLDTFSNHRSLMVVVVLPGLDRDAQRLAYTSEGD